MIFKIILILFIFIFIKFFSLIVLEYLKITEYQNPQVTPMFTVKVLEYLKIMGYVRLLIRYSYSERISFNAIYIFLSSTEVESKCSSKKLGLLKTNR